MSDGAEAARLAELTVALSLATDLATGQPLEHGLRTCCVSLKAAEALGLGDADRSCVYHVALLRFLGCTSDAWETAVLAGGDDVVFNGLFAPMLNAQPGEGLRFLLRHLAEDLPLRRRLGHIARALADPAGEQRSLSAHCEVASRLAERIGMPPEVQGALAHAYERWDGRGYPDGLEGDAVPVAIRVVSVARDAELWFRQGGWTAVKEVLAHRRGRAYDPSVVDVLLAEGEAWLRGDDADLAAAVLDAEPEPTLTIGVHQIDEALAAVADFVDLKSPHLRGHSSGVAALGAAAAAVAGLHADAAIVRRAGLVHDVGRVGVAAGIWGRPGPLSVAEWERVRLHTYFGERVLSRSLLLAPYAPLASAHHERADGSGYHRGVASGELSIPARLLAAADTYHAMIEDRPHRPAFTPEAAASHLLDEVDAGRLGRAEVDAVLSAAGQSSRAPQVGRPAGLTEREVDVLRLIARGQANRQVAVTLGISTKTVGRHVEHIYAKAGVTTRAGAALFAMESGLLIV